MDKIMRNKKGQFVKGTASLNQNILSPKKGKA